MKKKSYEKAEWQEFRKEVLELVRLYHQVKEYSEFDKDKIEYIKNFFHSSRSQAITSFFIKVGFLVTDGSPTLKNFLEKADYDELMNTYVSKVGLVRDKLYAHNVKTDKKLKKFTLFNEDVEELFAKIILSAQAIDRKFEEPYLYDYVSNADGIKSIESLINDSIELHRLKNDLMKSNFNAQIELEISSGKIKIV